MTRTPRSWSGDDDEAERGSILTISQNYYSIHHPTLLEDGEDSSRRRGRTARSDELGRHCLRGRASLRRVASHHQQFNIAMLPEFCLNERKGFFTSEWWVFSASFAWHPTSVPVWNGAPWGYATRAANASPLFFFLFRSSFVLPGTVNEFVRNLPIRIDSCHSCRPDDNRNLSKMKKVVNQ